MFRTAQENGAHKNKQTDRHFHIYISRDEKLIQCLSVIHNQQRYEDFPLQTVQRLYCSNRTVMYMVYSIIIIYQREVI